MANKVKTVFFCSNCGNESPKWLGRCPACGEWNTMVEAPVEAKKPAGPSTKLRSGDRKPRKLKDIDYSSEARISLGSKELDRLLGGGLVPGSLILLGGEPGIGKSTLSLQIPPVNIAAADGNTLDFNPSLEISGNEVNLHPSTVKSFNLDQDISYYSLYEDNLIPLHPGQYLLKVSAPGYVPARTNFEAVASGN